MADAVRISLGNNQVTLVDKADAPAVFAFRWRLQEQKRPKYDRKYAVRFTGKRGTIYLHRELLNAPKGMTVDHINGDGLDNRRCNLRLCTQSQNLWNSRPRNGTSPYKGVYWAKTIKRFVAGITVNGKKYHLCCTKDEEEAAVYYNIAAQLFFGSHARLNSL